MKNFVISRQYVECSKYFQADPNPKVVHEFVAAGLDQAKDEFFKFMAIREWEHEGKILSCDGNEIMSHGDTSADDDNFIFRVVEIN